MMDGDPNDIDEKQSHGPPSLKPLREKGSPSWVLKDLLLLAALTTAKVPRWSIPSSEAEHVDLRQKKCAKSRPESGQEVGRRTNQGC